MSSSRSRSRSREHRPELLRELRRLFAAREITVAGQAPATFCAPGDVCAFAIANAVCTITGDRFYTDTTKDGSHIWNLLIANQAYHVANKWRNKTTDKLGPILCFLFHVGKAGLELKTSPESDPPSRLFVCASSPGARKTLEDLAGFVHCDDPEIILLRVLDELVSDDDTE